MFLAGRLHRGELRKCVSSRRDVCRRHYAPVGFLGDGHGDARDEHDSHQYARIYGRDHAVERQHGTGVEDTAVWSFSFILPETLSETAPTDGSGDRARHHRERQAGQRVGGWDKTRARIRVPGIGRDRSSGRLQVARRPSRISCAALPGAIFPIAVCAARARSMGGMKPKPRPRRVDRDRSARPTRGVWADRRNRQGPR